MSYPVAPNQPQNVQHIQPNCAVDQNHGFAAIAVPMCPSCHQQLTSRVHQHQPQHQPAQEESGGGSGLMAGVVGAGAGLAGGMLLGSMFSDDSSGGDSDDDGWF